MTTPKRETPKPSRFAAYKGALSAISARTGTPLPSLVLSFAILHEVTAIAPLIAGFYAARALGVGERVVNAVADSESTGWAHRQMKTWMDEGELWTERVGRRYGFFGFEKRAKGDVAVPPRGNLNMAGDIANAVVAYGAAKAILPIRIGLSLYLSPAFSRGAVEPVRRAISGIFRRS